MQACRICLKESQKFFNIFSFKEEEKISQVILKLIPELKINDFDELTKYICSKCWEIIFSFYELKKLSIKNDKIQRSMLLDKKPFTFIKEEPDDDEFDYGFDYSAFFEDEDLTAKFELKPLTVNIERLSEDFKVPDKKRNSESKNKFKCDECEQRGIEKTFRNRIRLENHMRSIHKKLKNKDENDENSDDEDDFLCHICLKVFPRRESLLAHTRKTHKIYVGHMKCDVCLIKNGKSKMFRVKANLERHMMSEHLGMKKTEKYDSEYYQCNDCSTTHTLFRDLQSHSFYVHNKIVNEEPEKAWKRCSFCKEKFPTKHQLACHYDHAHPEERRKYPCPHCSNTFMQEDRLQRHIKATHGENAKKCTICNEEFNTKRDFILHKYVHCDYVAEYTEPIRFECVLCSFWTNDQDELYNHLPFHVQEFNQPGMIIVCINCSKIIENFEILHTHTGEHNENVTHQCLKCEKKFVMGSKLLKHLMKHDEDLMKKCPYENCKFKSSEKFILDGHIKHKHQNIVFHLCFICGQSFGTRGSLKSHIANLHEDNKNFKCNLCPKTFRIAAHLRNHQAVHSNEYTFNCDHPGCTKVFKAKRNLLRHKTFHDPSKLNYKHHCSFENCGKKFLKRDALNRHMLSHTKIKPYECTWEGCDRAFSQSNDLHKHLKQHFGHDRVHACKHENCNESFRLKAELRLHEAIHYIN